MRKVYRIGAILLALGLVAPSGCVSARKALQTQSYTESVLSRQRKELPKVVYGELREDIPLDNLDAWQPVAERSARVSGGEITGNLLDTETRTMVVLTDQRSTLRARDSSTRTLESDEVYAKWRLDTAEIRREEMAREAFVLRIFHAYEGSEGARRFAKRIVLPEQADVSEVSFTPGRGKYRTTWRRVFHDPYVALYPSFVFGTYVPPAVSEFQQYAAEWTFRHRLEDTWSSAVSVATQCQGILFLQSRDGERTLICRRIVPVLEEKNQIRYEVIALAVMVLAGSDGLCKVYCAPMSPDGILQPLQERSLLSFPREEIGSDSADSLNYLAGCRTVVNKLSSHFGPVKGKRNKKRPDDGSEDVRRKAICVHRFFQEMGTQLFAPGVLVKKYASQSAAPSRSRGELASFSPKTAAHPDYAAAAARYGQEAADYLRLSQVQIADRDTAVMLQNIIDQMVKAVPGLAPALPGQVRVQVLASPDVQAFALPNGDIFICTGLLDILDNDGELAVVLAHELCHVASKDAAAKMRSEDKARDFMKKVQFGLAVAGGIVAPVVGMAAASAGGVSSLSSQLASSLTSSMIQQVSPIAAAMMAEAALEGYSQEAELQADRFAVTTAACAGYEPQAMISVLTKLQDVEERTRTQGAVENRLVQSSLINAKPGLKKRISEVERLLHEKR